MARDRRGASAAELALVMPLLLLLAVGVADLGRAFNNYIVITNASREGARYASHFPSYKAGIENATIAEAAGSGVALTATNISIIGLGTATGQPIKVQITYDFSTIVGSIAGLPNLTLRSGTEMVVFGPNSPP